MPDYEGKNGLRRDLGKLRYEWLILRRSIEPHTARWKKRPWDTHAYVNVLVESARLSPYLIGHIDAFVYPLFIISTLFALWG